MSPTKTTKPALAQLEELREEARKAHRRADEADAEVRGGARRRDSAASALRNYYAGIEGGDPPDKARAKELHEALADIEANLVARTSSTHGRQTTTYIDVQAEGRAQGARDLAARADMARDEYIRDHSDELQAELIERSIAARDRLMDALAELADADGQWRTVRHRWSELGLADPGEVPPPLDIDQVSLVHQQILGGAKDRRGAFPCPVRHAPGGETEERDAFPLRGWERHPVVVSSMHGLGTP
jgi:hypothetical protein